MTGVQTCALPIYRYGTITEFHIESISVFLDNMNHLLL